MHARKTCLAAVAAAIALGGCETIQDMTGGLGKDEAQVAGAATGATAAAALTGWGTLGIVLASIGGGLVGDDLVADKDTEQALAKGEPSTLRGKGGKNVDVRTVREFQSGGRTCRELVLDPQGPAEGRTVTACQDKPGQWELVQEASAPMAQQGGEVPAIAPSEQLVRKVQQELQAQGMDAGPVDGRWSPQTAQAVRRFQQARGLDATGQLDMRTLQALGISGEPAGAGGTGMQK